MNHAFLHEPRENIHTDRTSTLTIDEAKNNQIICTYAGRHMRNFPAYWVSTRIWALMQYMVCCCCCFLFSSSSFSSIFNSFSIYSYSFRLPLYVYAPVVVGAPVITAILMALLSIKQYIYAHEMGERNRKTQCRENTVKGNRQQMLSVVMRIDIHIKELNRIRSKPIYVRI